MSTGEPLGQTSGCRGRGRGDRAEPLPCDIGALPVQPDQMILTRQIRTRHRHDQLTSRQATVSVLDRPDPSIQCPHDGQPSVQLLFRA
jgi:hypothetical protein